MHVALIPIIKKQLVSSRLQHAEKENPNIPDARLQLAARLQFLPPVNHACEHPYIIV